MRTRRIVLISLLVLIGLAVAVFAINMFLIAAGIGPYGPPKARKVVTATQLRSYGHELEWFRKYKGAYPRDIAQWNEWMGWKQDDERSRKRYLDGWGRTIRYVPNNPKLNPGKFDLYSVGPNGKDEYDKPGFGDDIHFQGEHVRFFGQEK